MNGWAGGRMDGWTGGRVDGWTANNFCMDLRCPSHRIAIFVSATIVKWEMSASTSTSTRDFAAPATADVAIVTISFDVAIAVGVHDAIAIATDGGIAVVVNVLVAATVRFSFSPLHGVREPFAKNIAPTTPQKPALPRPAFF